ncbi:hypothetical protein HRbin26_02069 [bacterium HR26]|nr:hypothetical protein HRbin26_02069 [bacterium HR26]
MCRHHDGIDRPLRPRGMATDSPHRDLERVGRRRDRPGGDRDLPGPPADVDVQRHRGIDRWIFQHAVVDHRQRAAGPLLGRLEHQLDRTGEVLAQPVEHLGYPEQDRGVDIVPAGVHHAGASRAVGSLVLLLDRQRVHIRAQEQRLARPLLAANQRDDPGTAGRRARRDPGGRQRLRRHEERAPIATHPCPVLDPELAEVPGHQSGRVHLLQRELGVHVQVAPGLPQPGVQLRRDAHQLGQAHRSSPSRPHAGSSGPHSSTRA